MMLKAESAEGVNVCIRMRPLNEREMREGQQASFHCNTAANSVIQDGTAYHYDRVFDQADDTSKLYASMAKDIVQGVTAGINGTVFAYGQTSSGKTHTMLGSGAEHPGVLEMAAADIFAQIGDCPNRDFLLRVSFVEIYNENIRDLLSDSDATINIREDPRKGVYCEASEVIIVDYESIIKTLKKGISRRAVEATAMNDTSSRSHTIFKIIVESKDNSSVANGESDGAVLVASLNLVDLAGSESVRHTGATGQRAKEGGKINQSLLSLSRVIHALSQPGTHVSFRDSKLTRLLQPSLSGNAKMSVVCCITPAEKYLEETRSTLQFASRAKLVKTDAKVNEVLDESAQLKRLRKELEELKEKQKTYVNGKDGGGRDGEEYARLEADKEALSRNLASLQHEKDQQRMQLDRLRSMIVFGGGLETPEADADRKRGKRARETWCPGAKGEGAAPLAQQRARLAATTEDLNSSRSSAGEGDDSFSSRGSSVWSGDTAASNKENRVSNANERSFDGGLSSAEHEVRMQLQTLADVNALLQSQLQVAQNTIATLQEELDDANETEELEPSPTATTAINNTQAETSVALLTAELARKDVIIRDLQALAGTGDGQLAESLSIANKQVEELSTEVSHAEELLGEMEKEHESLTQLLFESSRREEALAQAVQDADADSDAIKLQLVTLEGQLEESVAELQLARASHDADTESKVSSSLAAAAAAAAAMAAMEAAAQDLGAQLEAAEEAYADAIDKYESAQDDIVNTKAKLEEAEAALLLATAKSSDLAAQLSTAECMRGEAESQRVRLIEQLGSEQASASQLIADRDAEIAELQAAVTTKSSEIATLLSETRAPTLAPGNAHGGLVNNRVGESELTQQDIDSARRDMERVIEAMRADLGKKDSEISALMASVVQLESEVTNITQQLCIVEKAHSAEADEGSKKKISQLQTATDLLRGEKESLQKKLQDAESELKAATDSFALKEERMSAELSKQSAIAGRMQEKQQLADRLLESVKALEERVRETASSRDEYKLISASAQAQLAAATVAHAAEPAANSSANLEAEMVTLRRHVAELEVEASTDAGRLRKSREEIALLQGELERCYDDLARAGTTQSALEAASADMALQLQTAEQQVQELTDALVEAEAMKEQDAELVEHKEFAEIALLQGEVRRLQEGLAQLEGELRGSEKSYLTVKEERDSLGYEVSTLQKEISTLHDSIAAMRSQLALTTSQDKSCDLIQEMNALLEAKFDLESKLSTAQDDLKELQDKVSEYDRKARQDQELLMLAAEREIASVRTELERARADLQAAVTDSEGASEEVLCIKVQCEAHENTISRLHEEYLSKIEVKDKRLAHLETCKLTKEQLEKINTLKEDKRRYQEDSKVMKKQLSALKKAYDELKVAAAAGGASVVGVDRGREVKEMSDLKVHVAEITSKLETAQNVAKALKDKLKECSHQLQEYETERIAVIEVLDKYAVDTSGLNSIVDNSLEDASAVDEDLAVVIGRLAESYSLLKESADSVGKSSSGRIRDLEARVKVLTEELSSSAVTRQSLEERIKTLKAAHRNATEEMASLTAEAETLRARSDELASGLSLAESRLGTNAETVSSEIQCLEEENIELMKENRELRKEVSAYKQGAKLAKVGGAPTDHCVGDDKENSVVGKRKSTTPCRALDTSMASASKASATSSKRTRNRAKPLISIHNATADAAEGEAAECTQS